MKLIGKQIVVELPENKTYQKELTVSREVGPNTRVYIIGYNFALSEVARMNPAMEVDEEALENFIGRLQPWTSKDIAQALASNPSKWMKRKDSDEAKAK